MNHDINQTSHSTEGNRIDVAKVNNDIIHLKFSIKELAAIVHAIQKEWAGDDGIKTELRTQKEREKEKRLRWELLRNLAILGVTAASGFIGFFMHPTGQRLVVTVIEWLNR